MIVSSGAKSGYNGRVTEPENALKMGQIVKSIHRKSGNCYVKRAAKEPV